MKGAGWVKGAALLVAVLFVVLAFVSVSCAGEIRTVCPTGCEYSKIQNAIDAANPQDIIEVYSGTYYENVNVDKPLILRGIGTDGGKPVVDARGNGSAIRVIHEGIVLDGFTTINAGSCPEAGIAVYANNNVIINNTASNNFYGVRLDSASNNNLTGNAVSNNSIGIYLLSSNSNNLTNNTANSNKDHGIYLLSSCSNNLTDNTANANYYHGMCLYASSNNNTLAGNTASYNDYGIYLFSSCNNNTLTGNNASWYNEFGIYLYASSNNYLTDNIANVNKQVGIHLDTSSNNYLTDNTAHSNEWFGIYLWISNNNSLICNIASENSGGILLASSSNNSLTGNSASNNSDGILLSFSSNHNNLTGNNASNNLRGVRLDASSNNNRLTGNFASNNTYEGIYLSSSNNNTFTNNTANSNHWYGIYLTSSCNNLMYNNYFNNTNNALDNGNNIWNITKTSGRNIIGWPNLGGNYWSDYTGKDTNGDGIGDTPYDIPGGTNKDYLPLVAPPIFDTGKGVYPSIAGTHNGTIKPSLDLSVSKLYTYPCTGTGGHTEYVKIWNATWAGVEAYWDGYHGDWYNITLPEFTLVAGEEYNYTIETGSYPQIIHESEFNATGGTITCTEFVDANGKRHEDWIPALKLQ